MPDMTNDETSINVPGEVKGANVNIGGQQNFYGTTTFNLHGEPIPAPQPAVPLLFISCAPSDDLPFVRRLAEDLTLRSFRVRWNQNSVANQDVALSNEIRDAIVGSEHFLLVLGPNAIASPSVTAEWRFAQGLCKPIIQLLRVGDYVLVPDDLKSIDALDFRNNDEYPNKLEDLLRQAGEHEKSLGTVNNVPPLPAWYVNRYEVFDKVSSILREVVIDTVSRVNQQENVILWGASGTGKTVLASAIAYDCEIRRRFEDGVFWVELGENPDVELRQAELISALGGEWHIPQSSLHGQTRLNQLLTNKSALLVLNDVWSPAILQAFSISGVKCKYLITTRNQAIAVQIGGAAIHIGSLSPMEGLALIANKLNDSDILDNPSFVSNCMRIVDSLGGHPQALSIAAAQLARRGPLFVGDLADRLNRRLGTSDPFQDLTPTDAVDKRFNLELSLSLSYQDLSEKLKTCFRILGIFDSRGTFDALAVTAILEKSESLEPHDMDTSRTQDLLDTLVTAGLVLRHQNGRYSLHRIVKFYAIALLRRADEFGDAIAYATNYYLFFRAATILAKSPEHWRELQSDLVQIHSVADFWATELAGTSLVPAAISKLEKLDAEEEITINVPEIVFHSCIFVAKLMSDYIRYRNVGVEGLMWLRAGLLSSKILKNEEGLAGYAIAIGDWYESQGDYNRAGDYFLRGAKTFTDMGDKKSAVPVLIRLGWISDSEGLKQSIERIEKITENTDDEITKVEAWSGLGALYDRIDEHEKALHYDMLAKEYWEKKNNKVRVANLLNNIAMVYNKVSRFDEALQLLEEALAITIEVGVVRPRATCLMNIGVVYKDKKDREKALQYYLQALPLAIFCHDAHLESSLQYGIGTILWSQNHWIEAINAMQRSKEIKIGYQINTEAEDKLLDMWLKDDRLKG